ncbi:hypothetical protein D3C86_793210 [compost metagenome]
MNGIEFIVRDRSGWRPRIPLPRRRITAEEVSQVRTLKKFSPVPTSPKVTA